MHTVQASRSQKVPQTRRQAMQQRSRRTDRQRRIQRRHAHYQ